MLLHGDNKHTYPRHFREAITTKQKVLNMHAAKTTSIAS